MVDVFGTLGPACKNIEVLDAMFENGMTGMRINLSHTLLFDCKDEIEKFIALQKNMESHQRF